MNLKVAYSALLGFFLLGAALLAVGMYLSSLTDSIVGSAAVCFVVVLVNYYLSALASYVPTGDVAALCALLFLSALAAFVVLHLTQSPLAGLAALAVCGGAVAAAWFLARDAFDGLLPALFKKLCLFESFYGFLDGVFDWTALCLLVSVCAVFPVLTVQSLEKDVYKRQFLLFPAKSLRSLSRGPRKNWTALHAKGPVLCRAFLIPVSYTHLDVYKRQIFLSSKKAPFG